MCFANVLLNATGVASSASQEREAQARRQMLEEERRRREEVERRLQEETAHRQRLVDEEVKLREKHCSQVSGLKRRLIWPPLWTRVSQNLNHCLSLFVLLFLFFHFQLFWVYAS